MLDFETMKEVIRRLKCFGKLSCKPDSQCPFWSSCYLFFLAYTEMVIKKGKTLGWGELQKHDPTRGIRKGW